MRPVHKFKRDRNGNMLLESEEAYCMDTAYKLVYVVYAIIMPGHNFNGKIYGHILEYITA